MQQGLNLPEISKGERPWGMTRAPCISPGKTAPFQPPKSTLCHQPEASIADAASVQERQ